MRPKKTNWPDSGMFGTVNSNPVSSATGTAENSTNGRSLPHRVRVMSMRLPIRGSAIASRNLATVMIVVTTAMPAVLMCTYCSRYSRMNVVTVVRMTFCPKPAATSALPWIFSGMLVSAAVVGVVAVIVVPPSSRTASGWS